jgi:hypothetical protein
MKDELTSGGTSVLSISLPELGVAVLSEPAQ